MELGELVARLVLDTSKFTASSAAANVSIAQMGRSLDAVGAKKVQNVIDAMNGSVMEANKRQTAFNAAVLKNVKAIEAARLQTEAYRVAQEQLGMAAESKLTAVSKGFREVGSAASAMGVDAGGAFGKMASGASQLANAIMGGGAMGVAGGLVAVFGLVAGAISMAKDRMEEFKRTAEEAASAVDKQFAHIVALSEGAVGGSRYKTMSSDDLEKERKRLAVQAAGAAALARNLMEQAEMKRAEIQADLRRRGAGESTILTATTKETESLMLQAEELAQKAANLRKQMVEIRSTESSGDGYYGKALAREAKKQEAENGAAAAAAMLEAANRRKEAEERFLGIAQGSTFAMSTFATEVDGLRNALAFAGGPLMQVATATTLLAEAASSAAEALRIEADAFARGLGTGDLDAVDPTTASSGMGWLATAMGGPFGAIGAMAAVMPTDKFQGMTVALDRAGKAAERNAAAHKEVAGILERSHRAATDAGGGLRALLGLSGMSPSQLAAAAPEVFAALRGDKTARGIAGQVGSIAGMRGSEVMSDLAKGMQSVGPALPLIGSLLQGLADRFTKVMGEAVDYVGKLFEAAFEAVSAPVQDVLGKAFGSNRALGALGGGAQQGLAAGGTLASLAVAPMLAGLAGGPTTALVTLLVAPLVAPLVAALAPLTAGVVGLGAGLMELSTQTRSYGQWQAALVRATQPLVDAMEPLWRNLLPLTQQFLALNRAVGAVIGAFLPGQDMAVQLYEANRVMVMGAINVAIGLGLAHNAVNDVTRKFIEVHNQLDKLFNRGRNQKDAAGIHDTNIDAMLALRGSVEGASYAADMAAAELGNLSRAARDSMNIPMVARVSAARYAAMLDEEGRMASGGPSGSGPGGRGGGGGGTFIAGDVHVHGADLDQAIAKLKRADWQQRQSAPASLWPSRWANRG